MTAGHQKHAILAFVFSATLFLSAALMFSIQPMVGKMLLPIVGGTPAGWIVAMAFFQIMLLAGYFLAHFLSTVKPVWHGALFLAALCLGFIFLPAHIVPLQNGVPGPFDVFRMLFATIAVPFVALSAASSTLQRLFTQTGHPRAHDPYFLYAISNLGSFVGLFAYPFLVDPLTGLKIQGYMWLAGYVLLVLFVSLSLFLALRGKGTSAPGAVTAPPEDAPTVKQKLYWIALAFFPSSLLLGVTTHITSNIFPAPMMWVIPLGLYLVTFIIAFGNRKFVSLEKLCVIHPAAVALTVAATISNVADLNSSWLSLVLHMGIFGLTALMCHMRLAELHPSGKNLTAFYLMLSIGGALGGVLNAFIAPVVLNSPIEYPIILVLSLFVNPLFRSAQLRNGAVIRYAMSGMLIAFVVGRAFWTDGVLVTDRSFFGTLTVIEATMTEATGPIAKGDVVRALNHGTTLHGMQIMTPAGEKLPGSYYTTEGPVGNVFATYKPAHIAVVGLGVGAMTCYVPAGGSAIFIDIDPAIIKAADKYFTYVDKCSPAGRPEIILADGRLAIERIKDRKFDLIALDAFSADAIPTHLLTVEAIEAYRARLKDGGVLLFNISNRYANLAPVLARNAEETGLAAYVRHDRKVRAEEDTGAHFEKDSRWLVILDKSTDAAALLEKGWVAPDTKGVRPWTDDYTNLAATLSIFGR
ncbi:MAG: fused MFS/spermidine synthase [bacterium]|nr:fused MFS/spermidine synthase [bacterium]